MQSLTRTPGVASARASPCPIPRRAVLQTCHAGFGKSNKKIQPTDGAFAAPTGKRKVDLAEEFAKNRSAEAPAGASKGSAMHNLGKGTWAAVGSAAELFANKPIKPVVLATGKAFAVYKVGDSYYASDAASTAYEYPLIDGKILSEAGGPAIESPLDGTVYDLATGKVLKWCPSEGGLVRGLLGTLKKNAPAVDLKVYPAALREDGQLMVRLAV